MDKREVVEYLDEKGNSPFGKWFSRINVVVLKSSKIQTSDKQKNYGQSTRDI